MFSILNCWSASFQFFATVDVPRFFALLVEMPAAFAVVLFIKKQRALSMKYVFSLLSWSRLVTVTSCANAVVTIATIIAKKNVNFLINIRFWLINRVC